MAATPLTDIEAISAGYSHTCVVTTAGGVKCWGENERGELGDGTRTLRTAPVEVAGLSSGVTAISAGALGDGHTCALTDGGGVKCWGMNERGELGDGTRTLRTTPVEVAGLSSGVTAISAGGLGDGHTCALTDGGGVKCWGTNLAGEAGAASAEPCGTGTPIPCVRAPVAVPGLSDGVAGLSGGQFFTCATTEHGGVRCWGDNRAAQLGNGRQDDLGLVPPPQHPIPSSVVGLGTKLSGDADCWRGVSSIDAALLLQYEAGLVDLLPCPFNADVNDDGAVNSLDAVLVLQDVAGLLAPP